MSMCKLFTRSPTSTSLSNSLSSTQMAKKSRTKRCAEKAKKQKAAQSSSLLLAVQLVYQSRPQFHALAHVQELTSSFADTSVELEFWKACRLNSIALLNKIWSSCRPETEPSPADGGPGHSTTFSRRLYLRSDKYYNHYQFRLSMVEAVKHPGLEMVQWLFDHFKGCVVPNKAVEYVCGAGRVDILQYWKGNGLDGEIDLRQEQEQERRRNAAAAFDPLLFQGHHIAPAPGEGGNIFAEFLRGEGPREGLAGLMRAQVPRGGDVHVFRTHQDPEMTREALQVMMAEGFPEEDDPGNQAVLEYLRGGPFPERNAAALDTLDRLLRGEMVPMASENGGIAIIRLSSEQLQAFHSEQEEEEVEPELLPEDLLKHTITWGGDDIARAIRNKHSDAEEWLEMNTYADRKFGGIARAAVRVGNVASLDAKQRDYSVILTIEGLMKEAVAAGSLAVMKWLYGHNYSEDGGLAVYEAVKRDRLDLMKWLIDHKQVEAGRALRVAAGNGRLEMARQLYDCYWQRVCQQQHYPLTKPKKMSTPFTGWIDHEAVLAAAERGYFDAVKWMVETFRDEPKCDVFDESTARSRPLHKRKASLEVVAREGHLAVLKYLLAAGMRSEFTTEAMDQAAANNHLDMVQWLHTNRTEGCTKRAMDLAASNGYLEMVHWLHENRNEGCSKEAMDHAAQNGHLEVVKWLHENRSEGCTTEAMDRAAQNGHLEVVQWLNDNRWEGCTTKAMDYAAHQGHLAVVEWLHSNRSEGCTTEAMDGAARNGYLDVVKWLHENRKEGCTTGAMDGAAKDGHREVVYWLQANRQEGCTSDAMDNAVICGDFELVLFLHAQYIEGCTERAFDKPEGGNQFFKSGRERPKDIYEWLDEYYPDGDGP